MKQTDSKAGRAQSSQHATKTLEVQGPAKDAFLIKV